MPLNVRRSYTSVVLVLFGFILISQAQTTAVSSPTPVETRTPTSGEVMRERISTAKANIAVRNYNAAIYELETIRRETNDVAVNAVVNGLLMNTYIDQGDYKRAEDFLLQTFNSYRSNNANADVFYSAVAGQVVKGSRNKVDRYRAFGLMVSDRNLPLEAVNDLERMRQILELVITQSKELSTDQAKAKTAVALLEEATTSRSSLGRDDYDAKRWRDALTDSREQMANSRSTIVDVVDPPRTVVQTPDTTTTASAPVTVVKPITETAEIPAAIKTAVIPASVPADKTANAASIPEKTEAKTVLKPVEDKTAPSRPSRIVKTDDKSEKAASEPAETIPVSTSDTSAADTGPMKVGSLIGYATNQATPVYPPSARSMRASGLVRVEVVVDENGDVEEVQDTAGPTLLQAAARDAARKWKFRPFTRDGQPVKAVGFLNFNFTL